MSSENVDLPANSFLCSLNLILKFFLCQIYRNYYMLFYIPLLFQMYRFQHYCLVFVCLEPENASTNFLNFLASFVSQIDIKHFNEDDRDLNRIRYNLFHFN